MGFAIYICSFLLVGTIHGLQLPSLTVPTVIPKVEIPVDLPLLGTKLEKLEPPQEITRSDIENAKIAVKPSVIAKKMFGENDVGCTDMENRNGDMTIYPTDKCAYEPGYEATDLFGSDGSYMKWQALTLKINDSIVVNGTQYPARFLSRVESADKRVSIYTMFYVAICEKDNSALDEMMSHVSKIVKSGAKVENLTASYILNPGNFKCNLHCTYMIDDPTGRTNECYMISCVENPLFCVSKKQYEMFARLQDESGKVPERKLKEAPPRPEGTNLKCTKNPIDISWFEGVEIIKKWVG